MIKSLVIHKYANRFGRIIYNGLGYNTPEGFDFSKSEHPTEQGMYALGYYFADIVLSDKRNLENNIRNIEKKFENRF